MRNWNLIPERGSPRLRGQLAVAAPPVSVLGGRGHPPAEGSVQEASQESTGPSSVPGCGGLLPRSTAGLTRGITSSRRLRARQRPKAVKWEEVRIPGRPWVRASGAQSPSAIKSI